MNALGDGSLIVSMTEQLLPQVIELAKKAGDAIMRIYRRSANDIVFKDDNSPLTEADLTSDRLITEGLTKINPNWPVLSEESADIPFARRSDWHRFWLVDPLDGTKEFIKRNDEFTVNIALVENGLPVLGVVFAPALDICFYGAKGQGAYVERNQLPVRRIFVADMDEQEAVKVVASRSHCDDRIAGLLERLGRYEYISMGSSLKICLVAEGAAHFYPRLGPTMEWDTAAAHAIVNEAGGTVCQRSGAELVYNKPDLHNPDFFVLAESNQSLRMLIKELK